ncbi:hypothetical protein [Borreliella garinii]|nr:hypothetical protein [Borreliella garinii]
MEIYRKKEDNQKIEEFTSKLVQKRNPKNISQYINRKFSSK